MKTILLAMLTELEDLRATVGVLTALVETGEPSTYEARKFVAKSANQKAFAALREKIESLP